ncbi:MAG: thioredoxin family protein [Paracoccaceae bacterium]
MLRALKLAALVALSVFPLAGRAAELIMVEQHGCAYCDAWDAEVAPEYSKTDEGKFAPLRRVQLRDGAPDGVRFARPALFTPTFILVEEGEELARIEGYPGEDFFWGLLDRMLRDHTSYKEPQG